MELSHYATRPFFNIGFIFWVYLTYIISFQELENNIVDFVKNELKKFQTSLHPDPSQQLNKVKKDEEVLRGEDEAQRSTKEAFLNITLYFLKCMKQEQLADLLYSSKSKMQRCITFSVLFCTFFNCLCHSRNICSTLYKQTKIQPKEEVRECV